MQIPDGDTVKTGKTETKTTSWQFVAFSCELTASSRNHVPQLRSSTELGVPNFKIHQSLRPRSTGRMIAREFRLGGER